MKWLLALPLRRSVCLPFCMKHKLQQTKEGNRHMTNPNVLPHFPTSSFTTQLGNEEEHLQGLIFHSQNSPLHLPLIPPPAPPNKVTYTLSSGARKTPPFQTRSTSRITSPTSHGTFPSSITSSFMSLPAKSGSSFTDPHSLADFDIPPINLLDYMKPLLSQLAASILAIKIACSTHQQAALNPYEMHQGADRGQESSGKSDISTAVDKAMVEEVERLSQLHLQLSRLPQYMSKLQEQCTCTSKGADMEMQAGGVKKKKRGDSVMLKRYEDIITRFYDEIRRKDAVTAALKDTLAKSMLQAEILERRVKALEAQARVLTFHKNS